MHMDQNPALKNHRTHVCFVAPCTNMGGNSVQPGAKHVIDVEIITIIAPVEYVKVKEIISMQ